MVDLINHFYGKEAMNSEDPQGATLLMKTACVSTDFTMSDLVLKQGGQVNYQNNDGLSAMHLAVKLSNEAAIKYLLGKGGDPY